MDEGMSSIKSLKPGKREETETYPSGSTNSGDHDTAPLHENQNEENKNVEEVRNTVYSGKDGRDNSRRSGWIRSRPQFLYE